MSEMEENVSVEKDERLSEGSALQEEIFVDLNDHFKYSMESSHLSNQRHHLLSPPSETKELNGFEKLLQTNQIIPDITQTQHEHKQQTKNYFEDIQDCHEIFLTTQVDNRYKTLKSLYELTYDDFIQVDDEKSMDTSLQACVAMIFGYRSGDLFQQGGFLPPLSTRSANFEIELTSWITSHTNCVPHMIPFSQISSLDIHGGVLCIVYGMIKNSFKHCFVGYVEDRSSPQKSRVRCVLDPFDSDCVEGSHNIEDNCILLAEIDWIFYLDTYSMVHDRLNPSIELHTEVLSLEDSGLFTQDDHLNSDDCNPSETSNSYLKLAQSTVDQDNLNSIDAHLSEPKVIEAFNSECPATEDPTEIISVQEMSDYVTNEPPETVMCTEIAKPTCAPPSEVEISDSELEPTEIVHTQPLSPNRGSPECNKRPLLGFSPTQQVNEQSNSYKSPELEKFDNARIDSPKKENNIQLGFTQSQTPMPEKKSLLLGFTQTQHINLVDEPKTVGNREDNFVVLSHLTGESQYTFSTCPSQSQPSMLQTTIKVTNSGILESYAHPKESIIQPNPSLETVPSIQSHRHTNVSSGTVEAVADISAPLLKTPSEGWMTSKNSVREVTSLLEEETQSELGSQASINKLNQNKLEEVSAILKRLEEKEKELQERENMLKKKEIEISLLSKEIQKGSEEVTFVSPPPQVALSSMNKADSLSQGGVLAVDGLLQLKHAEPESSEPRTPPIESRFQWSSLKKLPEKSYDLNEVMPKPSSRLVRRKIGQSVESPQKKPISSFDFEPSPDEDVVVVKTSTNHQTNSSSSKVIHLDNESQEVTSQIEKRPKAESSQECEWDSQVDLALRTRTVLTESGDSLLPHNIPLSLRYRDDIEKLKWIEVWKQLCQVGWFWQKGRGLVDFAYCRPGKNYHLGIGTEGIDFFTSETAVLDYLTQYAEDRSPRPLPEIEKKIETIVPFSQSENDKHEKTVSTSRKRKSISDEKVVNPPHISRRDTISSLSWPELWRNLQADGWTWDHGSGLVTTWYLLPGVEKVSRGVAGKTMFSSEDDVRKYLMKQKTENSKHPNHGDDDDDDFDDDDDKNEVSSSSTVNWRNELKTLPWPKLWRNLQAEGWTWDHGSGLVERWYLRPGISKFSKGIVGVSVFGSQEDVRNHLLRTFGGDNSDQFNQKNVVSDSDDWELVKNRKRRNSKSHYQEYRNNLNSYYSNRSRKNTKRTDDLPSSSKKLKKSNIQNEESTQQQDIYQADFSESDSRERESDFELHRMPYVANRSTKRPFIIHEKPQATPVDITPPHGRSDTSRSRTEATPDYLLKTLPKILSPKLTSPLLLSTTTSSPLSSSSTGMRQSKKKISDSEKIFYKIKLFFTGISPPYDREELEKKVERNGGTVLTDKTLQRAITEGHVLDNTLVIACPSGFRRPNYLFAIAARLVLVHPKWIIDSLASPTNMVLPVDQYLLPSGSSVLQPYFIFRKLTPEGGVFNQLRVVCCNIPIWEGIIGVAGAIICPDTDDNISKYRAWLLSMLSSSRTKQNAVPLPDYVIVDSFMYAEGNLKPLVSDFIEQCMALVNTTDHTRQLIPKIVTTEWAAYCLGIGETIDPSLHGVFTLPSDRIRNSRVLKMSGDGGGGRYVVGDTVYFHISKVINDSHRFDESRNISLRCHQQYLRQKGFKNSALIGKIMSFVRRSATDVVQVKIRPLHVRCLQCEANSRTSGMSTSISSGSSPSPSERESLHHTYELHMNNTEGEIILSTSMLLKNYPTVLSSSSYQRLAYSQSDSNVYMSSSEWEGAMNYVTDSEYSQDDTSSATRPVYIQQSQDY